MNILFFSDNFFPEVNAAASRVFERACLWVKQGHQVTVITCAPNFPQGKIYKNYKNKYHQEYIEGIRVIRVKTFIAKNEKIFLRSLDFLSYFFTASFAALFQKKPDIVVANSPQLFAGFAGWLVASIKRVPFVLELADLWPASIIAVGVMQQNKILKWLEKLELFLYKKARHIVTLTASIKQDLINRHVDPEKITTILNGVDLAKFTPQACDKVLAQQLGVSNKFVIGYIGTHGMAHGLENILQAAERLQHIPEVCFLFVGDGAAKAGLKQLAQQKALTNVIFADPYPKEMMPAVWSICSVALVHLKDAPLFSGAVPSKIFEAMGMGLPLLLVAPEGEASVIIQNTQSGVCVLPENPQVLAEAVMNLKQDPPLLHRYAQNSRLAAGEHTRDKQASNFLETLQMVCSPDLTKSQKFCEDRCSIDAKRVLVTGANGFIGSVLCRVLLEENFKVRALVRKKNSCSVSKVFQSKNFECVTTDFSRENTDWHTILKDVDIVVHLAARVHVMHDQTNDPLTEYCLVNTELTKYLATMAVRENIKRFVYVSSIKVNGETNVHDANGVVIPFTEQINNEPVDAYGLSKWRAELALQEISQISNLETVILRPPLVYGRDVRANFLNLVSSVKRGLPLPLANIHNQRSLIYVENLAHAIITCFQHEKAVNQTFLVSDSEAVSTSELIGKIAAVFNRPPRLWPLSPSIIKVLGKLMGKQAAIDRLLGSLVLDCSKIKRELDWQPPYTMDDALRRDFKN